MPPDLTTAMTPITAADSASTNNSMRTSLRVPWSITIWQTKKYAPQSTSTLITSNGESTIAIPGTTASTSAAIGQVTGDGTHGASPLTTRFIAQLRPAAASSASVGVMPTAPSWNDSSSIGASAIAATSVYIGRHRLSAARAAPPNSANGTIGPVR